jgi:hypothetical protein
VPVTISSGSPCGAGEAAPRPLRTFRRAAIALAIPLALAAGGCGAASCAPPALDVSWGTFTDAAGQPFDCAAAGALVAGIRVLVDGTPSYGLDGGCVVSSGSTRTEAVRLSAVAAGAHEVDVQGVDADGRLRFADTRTVTVPGGCGAVARADATPAAVADDLGLGYSIAGGLPCPLSSYVWLSIIDVTRGTVFSVVDGQNGPTSIPCNTPLVFPAAPFGSYRLDFVQIVTPTGISAFPFRPVYQMCTPFPFDHARDDIVALPALGPATGPCTP